MFRAGARYCVEDELPRPLRRGGPRHCSLSPVRTASSREPAALPIIRAGLRASRPADYPLALWFLSLFGYFEEQITWDDNARTTRRVQRSVGRRVGGCIAAGRRDGSADAPRLRPHLPDHQRLHVLLSIRDRQRSVEWLVAAHAPRRRQPRRPRHLARTPPPPARRQRRTRSSPFPRRSDREGSEQSGGWGRVFEPPVLIALQYAVRLGADFGELSRAAKPPTPSHPTIAEGTLQRRQVPAADGVVAAGGEGLAAVG